MGIIIAQSSGSNACITISRRSCGSPPFTARKVPGHRAHRRRRALLEAGRRCREVVRRPGDLRLGRQEADEACDIRLGSSKRHRGARCFPPRTSPPYRTMHRNTKPHLTFLANESCAAALRSGDAGRRHRPGDDRRMRVSSITASACSTPHAVMMRTHELSPVGAALCSTIWTDARWPAPVDWGWMLPADGRAMPTAPHRASVRRPSRPARGGGALHPPGGNRPGGAREPPAAPPADRRPSPFDADERFHGSAQPGAPKAISITRHRAFTPHRHDGAAELRPARESA